MPRKNAPLAKLVAPASHPALPRPRLFRKLDAAFATRQIVWIVGAPGAGKTTLATSYLGARRRPALWYTMDAGDADLATLFHFLALASASLDGKKRPPLPQLIAERRPALDAFVRSFFHQLGERLPPKAILVFDDQQENPGGEELADVLSKGMPFLRAGQRVLVLSREEPPPPLARHEIEDRLTRLTDRDLRLDLAEARALARLRSKRPSAIANIERIQARTRGWAAGLVMLLDQRDPTAAPDVVLDFLAQEYVDRLPPGARACLIKVALAPRVTSKMAAALGVPQSMSMLSRMARRGAFVTHRQGAVPTYEVHPLLRELLAQRAEEALDPESLVERRRVVAQVSAEEGNDEVAANLYAANGDWQSLVALADARGPALAASGQTEMLERWLMLLPEPLRERDPRVAIWLGRCASGRNPPLAQKHFEAAHDLLAAMGHVEGQLGAWTGCVLNVLAMFDDMRALDPWIARIDALLPPPAFAHVRSAHLLVALVSAVTYRSFDHPRLDEWTRRSLDVLEATSDDPAALLALAWGLAGTFMDLGDHQRAAHVRALAERIAANAAPDPQLPIFVALTEGSVAARSGDGARGTRALARGERAASEAGIPVWNHLLSTFGVTAAFASGDLARARTLLASQSPEGTGRLGRANHAQNTAQLHLLEGELDQALEQAKSALRLTSTLGTLIPEAQSRLLLAEIHVARGELGPAADALDALDGRTDFAPSRYIEGQSRFARIDVAKARDQRVETARRAFEIARIHGPGIVLSAPTTPEAFVRRCSFALDEGIEVDTVCAILQARSRDVFVPPAWLERWPWPVRIQLLGRFKIVLDGHELKSGAKLQVRVLELLQLLVVERGAASESMLADALWPEADGDQALRALSIAVHRLRTMLGDPSLVERRAGRISLDRRRVFADVWAVEALLELARTADPERRASLLAAARVLHTGAPSPVRQGHEPPWLVSKGQRLARSLEAPFAGASSS